MSFPLSVLELAFQGDSNHPPHPIVTHSHTPSCTSSGPFWSPFENKSKCMQAALAQHTHTHSFSSASNTQTHTSLLKCDRARKIWWHVKSFATIIQKNRKCPWLSGKKRTKGFWNLWSQGFCWQPSSFLRNDHLGDEVDDGTGRLVGVQLCEEVADVVCCASLLTCHKPKEPGKPELEM